MAISSAYGIYIHWGGGASANGRMQRWWEDIRSNKQTIL